MPTGVAQKIERLQKEFYWGDGIEKRKIHTVNWATHSLWKKVFCTKYGVKWSELQWQWFHSNQDSAFVKSIHKLFKIESPYAFALKEGIQIVIGCGDRANFWEDIRWDSNPLKEAFPRIYALSLKKGALDSLKIRNCIHDTIAWSFGTKVVYSIHSFRKCLESSRVDNKCNYKLIWNGFFHPKVEVFVPLKLWTVCMSWWEVHCRHSYDERTIWESRNQSIFNNKETIVECTLDMIKCRVGWWFKYYRNNSQDSVTNIMLNLKDLCKDKVVIKRSIITNWSHPYVNGLKFNVDGSARGKTSPAGIGGVLRDSSGKILCVFFHFIGIEDSNSTDIIAIHRANELCASMSEFVGKAIVMASDSKTTVSWANNSDYISNFKYIDIIYDIRVFLKFLGNTTVVFNPRSSNSFANNLAKSGSNKDGDKLEWSLN
ncbi:hypothetical protein Ddye_012253 [Dipteronia dyeriana]|uniref:RNase H type-1 domain-containing protein n=1 Tax=Dipteronia dyeriana TaxID=168575 RepID=A0AAD9X435_9ROSI|nr:hypothetical protein Ddye_012253 [Dipteronia dyeriana]